MNEGIDTRNIQVLEDFFKDLSTMDQRRIFLSAFRKASAPIVLAAKQTVPKNRGNLWRSIGTKATRDETAIWVGSILNTPYVNPAGRLSKVWYGRLTEGGANNVGRPPGGYTRSAARSAHRSGSLKGGHIDAQHWFREALAVSFNESKALINQEWHEAIERYVIRAKTRMK